MTSRRLAALSVALVAALVPLSGCGAETEVVEGESEGIYLDVGELRYQVQISRQLNPSDADDRSYLQGIPLNERRLEKGESWFGVFVLVQNETKERHRAAGEFEIEDTQGQKFEPLELTDANDFAYRPIEVEPKNITPGTIPPKNSVAAGNTSIGGALLLFKVPISTFDNRPLKLHIKQPGAEPDEAEVDLDV